MIKTHYFFLLILSIGHASYSQEKIETSIYTPDSSVQRKTINKNKRLLFPQIPLTSPTDQITIQSGNVENLLVYKTPTVTGVTRGYFYCYQDLCRHKVSTTIEIDSQETLTFLAYDEISSTLVYTDERGHDTVITLKEKALFDLQNIIIGLYIFSIIIGVLAWYHWRKRNNKLLQNLQEIKKNNSEKIRVQTTSILQTTKAEQYSVPISDETIKSLLKGLAAFETNEKYLKKHITLTWLAESMNTNTKYLSETIKIHRDNSFRGYINGLRINYIICKLYEEPLYQEYKISYLAREAGYASSQVFVIAFKKETGFTPSDYIRKLKEKNK